VNVKLLSCAQSLSHILSSISGARRAVDSIGLHSPMDLLECAGERAASGAYADAQALQHAVSSLGAARINPRGVGDSVMLRSARVLLACASERADVKMPLE
jgi:hypothetical protein